MNKKTDKQKLYDAVKRAKAAQLRLGALSTAQKNKILADWARSLQKNKNQILKANAKDVKAARAIGYPPAFLDRLVLNETRLGLMAEGLSQVRSLPDPVREVVENYKRGGLKIRRVRIPLGLIAMIYESRPNVTVDAASLCFKSGNACVLRGGSEAFQTNRVLVKILQAGLEKNSCPPEIVTMLPGTDRRSMAYLLAFDGLVDVAIPRGGEKLMQFVKKHAKVPVIRHDKGVCSLFVDASADLEKSVTVVLNAKTQRPGVCNALETLYVHQKIAVPFLQMLLPALAQVPCEVRADAFLKKKFPDVKLARERDWGTEYLAPILAIKTVKDVQAALQCVLQYSSHHTDGILTADAKHAALYRNTLDSSCVMVNTSTRFNDGFELGLGAEMGISTSKLQAYGPMGLKELTTLRFEVESDYAVRR